MKNDEFKNKILAGDALSQLKTIPSNIVDTIVTSPPYFQLRNYSIDDAIIWDADESCEHDFSQIIHKVEKVGKSKTRQCRHRDFTSQSAFCSKCNAWKGQLGQEPEVDLFIKHLLQIFDECKRILKKTGSCFVVIGDTYNTKSGGTEDLLKYGKDANKRYGAKIETKWEPFEQVNKIQKKIPEKSLLLVPHRFAIKMIEHGWCLRNDIVWEKPNAMPSSAKDRWTNNYEHIFFFTKSPKKYYFNQPHEPYQISSIERAQRGRSDHHKWVLGPDGNGKAHGGLHIPRLNVKYLKYINTPYNGHGIKDYADNKVQNPSDVKRRILESMRRKKRGEWNDGGLAENKQFRDKEYEEDDLVGRVKRSIWKISTKAFKESHFAVFPQELVQECLDAACPPGGMICDPFLGTGTSALVALKTNRHFIGIEPSQKYIDIIYKRLERYLYQSKLTEYLVVSDIE